MSSMFELVDNSPQNAVIKVIGVGGGGCNAVQHMLEQTIEGVDFVCINTDAQALRNCGGKTILQIGNTLTKGLGAGANPRIGREAAEEDRDRLREILEGADMIFITCGMGGGTGTGGAPVVAEVAKEMGILTVAVVTRPFNFEGKVRSQLAEEGILELAKFVDSLITIPNDKLLSVFGKQISLFDAFKAANNVLFGAVQGIAELITRPGLINVDFADVRTVMLTMGMAMMGTGAASGENRATVAAESAISNPLLEDVDLKGAKGVLVNITAGMTMSIGEFEEVGEVIKGFISDNATVVVGTVIDPDMKEDMRVTVVVTGLVPPLGGRQVEMTKEGVRRDGSVNYEQLEKPTVMRQQQRVASAASGHHAEPQPTNFQQQTAAEEKVPSASSTVSEQDVEYLDIPAFLRKKEEV
jgi:cell division protein FtsZ